MEDLWFKQIKIGANEVANFCLKTLKKDAKFCLWYVENQLPVAQLCPASKTAGKCDLRPLKFH
jgi:hypothetical protein